MSSDNKEIKSSRNHSSPSKIRHSRNSDLVFRSSTKIIRELFNAIYKNDIARFRELVNHEFADVNAVNPWFSGVIFSERSSAARPDDLVGGMTLLIYAAKRGCVDIAKLLIQKEADLNRRDERGETALMKAFLQGNLDMIELLLEKGADINIADNNNQTILMVTVSGATEKGSDEGMMESRRYYSELAKFAIDHGAILDTQHRFGETALMLAVRRVIDHGLSRDIIRVLIAKGAKLDIKDESGETALLRALEKEGDDCRVSQLLVAAGADMGIKDQYGHDALAILLMNEEFSKAGALLQAVAPEKRQQLLQANLDEENQKKDDERSAEVIGFLHEELAVVNTPVRERNGPLVITDKDFDVTESKDSAEESTSLEESSSDADVADGIKRVVCAYSSPHKNKRRPKAESDSTDDSSKGVTSLGESSSDDGMNILIQTYSTPPRRKRKAEEESSTDSSPTSLSFTTNKKAKDVTNFWLRRDIGLDEGLMSAEQTSAVPEAGQSLVNISAFKG